MKIDGSKIMAILKAIYDAFLKGRKVNVGGTEVTLPSQGNVPPLKGSQFDSKPHTVEPPQVGGPRR